MSTTPSPAPRTPNLYELNSPDTHILYTTTSIAGAPQLTYQHGSTRKSWSGGEIRILETEIGRLVTVTLEAIPDLHSVLLTLIVPPVNLDGDQAEVSTEAIRTTAQTSIGGPRLVRGQITRYESVHLHGTAKSVRF